MVSRPAGYYIGLCIRSSDGEYRLDDPRYRIVKARIRVIHRLSGHVGFCLRCGLDGRINGHRGVCRRNRRSAIQLPSCIRKSARQGLGGDLASDLLTGINVETIVNTGPDSSFRSLLGVRQQLVAV